MPIYYDSEAGAFGIASEYCECGSARYDTGCDAPGCDGWQCGNCGTGCDVDLSDSGRCATALAAESDEDYAERVNTERAAFGLPSLNPGEA